MNNTIKIGNLVRVIADHGWWPRLKEIQDRAWDPEAMYENNDVPRHNVENKIGLVVGGLKDIKSINIPSFVAHAYYPGYLCVLIDETIWVIKPKYLKKINS